MDVFVSWSGGKDCTLSCHRAIKQGHNIRGLATMATKELGRMYPHHLTPEVLERQAEAMDLPLHIEWTKSSEYTDTYIKMLKRFRKEGITGGVFGDVSLGNPDKGEHLSWVEYVCQAADMEVILPLWGEDRSSLISDLISADFKAMIIAVDNCQIDYNWIGRTMDWEMLNELRELHSNSIDGRVGLYHTLTVDGPLFKKRLEINDSELVLREYGLLNGKPIKCPFWYLDIKSCSLAEKPELVFSEC
jgi:diphthine-ammonia ligase